VGVKQREIRLNRGVRTSERKKQPEDYIPRLQDVGKGSLAGFGENLKVCRQDLGCLSPTQDIGVIREEIILGRGMKMVKRVTEIKTYQTTNKKILRKLHVISSSAITLLSSTCRGWERSDQNKHIY
jgi:TnpA family transposase